MTADWLSSLRRVRKHACTCYPYPPTWNTPTRNLFSGYWSRWASSWTQTYCERMLVRWMKKTQLGQGRLTIWILKQLRTHWLMHAWTSILRQKLWTLFGQWRYLFLRLLAHSHNWGGVLKHARYWGQLRSMFHCCYCCFNVSTYTQESSLIQTFHIKQPLLLLHGRLTVQLISTCLYKLYVRYTYLSRLRYQLRYIMFFYPLTRYLY